MALFTRKRAEAPAAPALVAADPALAALTGDYTIDPAHSAIGFAVRHAMVTNVRGAFGTYEGRLHLDGSEPGRSTAALEIRTESIDTGIGDRDAHLRGGDFFDAGRSR